MSGTTAFILLVIITVVMLAPAIFLLSNGKKRRLGGKPHLALTITGFVLIGILATAWTALLAILIFVNYSFVLVLLLFLSPFIVVVALILLPAFGITLIMKGSKEKAKTGVKTTSFSVGIGLLVATGVLLAAVIFLFVYFTNNPISLM